MTRSPSLPVRAARLSSGLLLLLSLVLPMHGAGHALHGVPAAGMGRASDDASHGHHGHAAAPTASTEAEPGDDPHPGAPASCCTGPCVCPPLPTGPSARAGEVRIAAAPPRAITGSRATQAPPQAPIPHVLPFSTAPPLQA